MVPAPAEWQPRLPAGQAAPAGRSSRACRPVKPRLPAGQPRPSAEADRLVRA